MAPITRTKTTRTQCTVSIWVLLLSNILVLQLTWNQRGGGGNEETFDLLQLVDNTALPSVVATSHTIADGGTSSSSSTLDFILAPKQGQAEVLPSVRVAKKAFQSDNLYGGKGDKPHLGGFTDLDHHGVSPAAWKWMVEYIGVHSVMDIGCGRGISTSWFYFHGVDVLCAEGSHDAVENTVLPDTSVIVEHDFSRGPWWPEKTYDAVWCVEFLEHVGRNLQKNYLTAFRKSALIFATHSNWGGHHHVEVHDDAFWIQKFTMFGFVYSEELTTKMRAIAFAEQHTDIAPNGISLNAQHVWLNIKVFINPAVAALPQHAHLLAEPGCFFKREGGQRHNRECGDPKINANAAAMETKLPDEYTALKLTPEQDTKWFEHVKTRVKQRERDEELKQMKQQSQQSKK